MPEPITTAANVLNWMQPGATPGTSGAPSTSTLTLLTDEIIPLVTKLVQAQLGRTSLFKVAGFVDKPMRVRRHQRSLTTRWAPIDVDSFELREDPARGFDSGTVIESQHYNASAEGIIVMNYPLNGGAGTVQMTYDHGIGDDQADLEVQAPELVTLGNMLAAHVLERRNDMQRSSERDPTGGSVSYTAALSTWPKAAQEIVAVYRRITLR